MTRLAECRGFRDLVASVCLQAVSFVSFFAFIRLSRNLAGSLEQQPHDTQNDAGNDRHCGPDNPITRSGRIQSRHEHHGEPEVTTGDECTGQGGRFAEYEEGHRALRLHAFPAYLDPLMCQVRQRADQPCNQK
jgi:hypothetical protein